MSYSKKISEKGANRFNEELDEDEELEYHPPELSKKVIAQLMKDSGLRALRVLFIVGGIRSGFNILIKVLSYFRRRKPFQEGLLEALVGKEVRGSSIFFGGFVFTWKFLSRLLPIYYGKQTRLTDFVSGFIAGAFILSERNDRQVSFSQQLSVRAAQSFFTSLSSKNIFTIPHANSILFILSTSQILYSYVLHHETLLPSIYKFMVQQAQIPHSILEVNRRVVRGNGIDVESFSDLLKGLKATPRNLTTISKLSSFPKALPCVAYHPSFDSCTVTFFSRFSKVMKMILPVYAGLTFLPAIFLRFRSFKTDPKNILAKCALGTVRSSAFLATLVSIYQFTICNFRSIGDILGTKDHKFLYYIAAVISSTPAIFIEKPSRRTELSLYAIPKAIDSFYRILYSKSWVTCIPHFEAFMFMFASGTTMLYYTREPEVISPLLKWLLTKMIGKNKPKDQLPESKPQDQPPLP